MCSGEINVDGAKLKICGKKVNPGECIQCTFCGYYYCRDHVGHTTGHINMQLAFEFGSTVPGGPVKPDKPDKPVFWFCRWCAKHVTVTQVSPAKDEVFVSCSSEAVYFDPGNQTRGVIVSVPIRHPPSLQGGGNSWLQDAAIKLQTAAAPLAQAEAETVVKEILGLVADLPDGELKQGLIEKLNRPLEGHPDEPDAKKQKKEHKKEQLKEKEREKKERERKERERKEVERKEVERRRGGTLMSVAEP